LLIFEKQIVKNPINAKKPPRIQTGTKGRAIMLTRSAIACIQRWILLVFFRKRKVANAKCACQAKSLPLERQWIGHEGWGLQNARPVLTEHAANPY
jgi:hypothetical protein